MTQEAKYEDWFMVHSGLKPAKQAKGGFLSIIKSTINEVASKPEESQKPKEPQFMKNGFIEIVIITIFQIYHV